MKKAGTVDLTRMMTDGKLRPGKRLMKQDLNYTDSVPQPREERSVAVATVFATYLEGYCGCLRLEMPLD